MMKTMRLRFFCGVLMAGIGLSVTLNAGATLPETIQSCTVVELGPVVGFKDPNFLTLLKRRAEAFVASGEWEKRVQAVQARAARKALRPDGMSRPIALTTAYRFLDTGVNREALKPWNQAFEGFQRLYLFIDADRLADRAWAKALTRLTPAMALPQEGAVSDIKVVLTQGDLRLTQNDLQIPLYFDQGGHLSRRFHLEHLPALVVVTLDRILVIEPALNEEGVLLEDTLPSNVIEALPETLSGVWRSETP